MACPKCGCKTVYQYNGNWTGLYDGDVDDERLQRCAACGEVFDLDDHADEDDDHEEAPVVRIGDTVATEVTNPRRETLALTIETDAAANFATGLLRESNTRWRLVKGCSECGWGKVAGCWRCGSR